MVNETDDAGLKEIVANNPLVLVDFWAPWCMPCRKIAPIIEELETEFDDVFFCKVNIDENKQTIQENNVMSIPTLLLYKNSDVVEKITGFIPKDSIKEKINRHL